MTSFPSNYKEWLAKLISYETVSRNSNLELINYVKAYFESVGIQCTLIYKPEKTHANLWGVLPADDGTTQGGIILSGHTDVVPVDGQQWDTNPFQMVEKDGKLYGRGACDMKGFLAVTLALTPTFLKLKRAKPIHYAFSFDEEIGCTGVPLMTNFMKEKGFKADACLIGEPTDMNVYTGSKGMFSWKVTVQGKAIHSSMALMNTSCNAIEYAAQIIAKIRAIAEDLKKNGPHVSGHECPFSPISTGLIKGGNAVNTVPAECDFVFSVRVTDLKVSQFIEKEVSRYVNENILPAMREEFGDAKVGIEAGIYLLPFNADENAPFTKQACHLRKASRTYKIAGGTEGGYFQDGLGVPTLIVGPGSLGVAHQRNEFVLIKEMEESMAFTLDVVKLYTDPQLCQKGNL